MKKTIKLLLTGILFLGVTSLVGCDKEDLSDYVTKDEFNNAMSNSNAKTYSYNLTFSPGSTFEYFGGIKGYSKGDVVLTYILYEKLEGEQFWMALPYRDHIDGINWHAEFSDQDGFVFVMAEKDNGSSPFTSSYTRGFKSVLIKSTALKEYPDLDLSNYNEVVKAFDLEKVN